MSQNAPPERKNYESITDSNMNPAVCRWKFYMRATESSPTPLPIFHKPPTIQWRTGFPAWLDRAVMYPVVLCLVFCSKGEDCDVVYDSYVLVRAAHIFIGRRVNYCRTCHVVCS